MSSIICRYIRSVYETFFANKGLEDWVVGISSPLNFLYIEFTTRFPLYDISYKVLLFPLPFLKTSIQPSLRSLLNLLRSQLTSLSNSLNFALSKYDSVYRNSRASRSDCESPYFAFIKYRITLQNLR